MPSARRTPSGEGVNVNVFASVGGQTSDPLAGVNGFSYDGPVITNIIVPGGGAVTQGTIITAD